jgi:hypothetical protein
MLRFDPQMMGDDVAKDVLAKEVKRLIAEHGFTAVIALFDTFELKLDPDKYEAAIAIKVQLGLGVRDLAAAGFGALTECAKLMIQNMTGTCFELGLPYHRNGESGDVTSFDEITERNASEPHQFFGRFKFFEGNTSR